ncbi:MAG TPA: ABC transporter ATP-binding protein [Candidatus Polarisedimenticolaceae bacterium]|nr:ABC transporter ATP-binding protein [Candidatus Polarisedimenticolaceae bacterium]
MSTPALAFEEVGFSYGHRPVLRDLRLRLEPGELTALLGPNGTGKTTCVRLAAGSLTPQHGVVRLFGRDLRAFAAAERARTVAVVPQEAPLEFDFHVHEIVAMGRSPHQGLLGLESAEDRRAVEDALRVTGMQAHARRPFAALSGGEKQRVILARALAQRPRLLLLDEPTAHLDLKHRLAIYALLQILHREGLTTLVVSHDLNLAAAHCRRLVLFRCGEVVADGPPRAVLRREILREVYEVDLEVRSDGEGGAPFVVPL